MNAQPVLLRFIDLLRCAGLKVSVAETRDALQALGLIGYSDKARAQAALSGALAKSVRDKQVFDDIFTAFFCIEAHPFTLQPSEADHHFEGLTELSRALLAADGTELAIKVHDTLDRLDFSRLTAPTQRGAMIRQALEAIGWDRVAADITQMRGMPGGALSAQAEVLEQRSRALLEAVTTAVNSRVALRFTHRRPEPPDETMRDRCFGSMSATDRNC